MLRLVRHTDPNINSVGLLLNSDLITSTGQPDSSNLCLSSTATIAAASFPVTLPDRRVHDQCWLLGAHMFSTDETTCMI